MTVHAASGQSDPLCGSVSHHILRPLYAGDTKTACGCVTVTARLTHLHSNNTQTGRRRLGKMDDYSILTHAERPLTAASNVNVVCSLNAFAGSHCCC